MKYLPCNSYSILVNLYQNSSMEFKPWRYNISLCFSSMFKRSKHRDELSEPHLNSFLASD